MAKMTLQNISPSYWTCEECHGIMGKMNNDNFGSTDTDIPCPAGMNAIEVYGIAKECNYAEEQETEQAIQSEQTSSETGAE